MRVTKRHTGNRRSHHALKAPRLSLCSNCGEFFKRHRICLECGFYKGKKILEVGKKEKASKAKVENKEISKDENKVPQMETTLEKNSGVENYNSKKDTAKETRRNKV